MPNPHFLLFLSTVCYTLPFIAPYQLGWLIFLFPTFLFLAINTNKLQWFDYCAWALLTTTIHILPLGDAIIYMAAGPLYLRLIPAVLLVIYVSIYPAVWLLLVDKMFQQCRLSQIKRVGIWTISLWIYIIFIDYALFWAFGRCEGYVFMNPLLPLTVYPHLLLCLHWFSLPICLFLYCLTTSALTLYISCRSFITGICFIVSLTPWLSTMWIDTTSQNAPAWLKHVGHLPLMLPETMSRDRGAALIAFELEELATHYPSLQLVILPESAWNGLPLNAISTIPALRNHSVAHVIIGSFAQEHNNHFNSLYWFHNGNLKQRIDKQHAVPLVERIPPGSSILCNSLFFEKTPPICPSRNQQPYLMINDLITLVPYICSELFCNNLPINPSYQYPILAVCNDWWFRLHYFKRLMVLTARFRAIQWARGMLYLSFHHAQFFDKYGKTDPIATTPSDRFLK